MTHLGFVRDQTLVTFENVQILQFQVLPSFDRCGIVVCSGFSYVEDLYCDVHVLSASMFPSIFAFLLLDNFKVDGGLLVFVTMREGGFTLLAGVDKAGDFLYGL